MAKGHSKRNRDATPIVRLVSPADPAKTNSIAAFKDELVPVLGYPASVLKVYSATDPGSNLTKAAQSAVNDSPDVIVVGGSLAASIVLAKAPSTTVIIMVGGAAPSTGNNITGFLMNAQDIAKDHAKLLVNTAKTITVIYDSNNPPSANAYANGVVPIIPKAMRNPISATTYDDIKNLDGTQFTDGLMLIPNATFYQYFKEIVRKIDGNPNVKQVYYPEREYKHAHTTSKKGVQVHGHNIPLTFRMAANYVDSVLNNDFAVGSLPDWKEAVTDDC